ncbi:hypothetical protein MMC27_000123 [Xylographa pallens]|nr:hypothetical protein [Xylographa pallens]
METQRITFPDNGLWYTPDSSDRISVTAPMASRQHAPPISDVVTVPQHQGYQPFVQWEPELLRSLEGLDPKNDHMKSLVDRIYHDRNSLPPLLLPLEAEREIQRLQREVQRLTTANNILRATTGTTSISHQDNSSGPCGDLNAPSASAEVISKALGPPERSPGTDFMIDEPEAWNRAGDSYFRAKDRLVADLDSERNITPFSHSFLNGDRHHPDVPNPPEYVRTFSGGENQEVVDLSHFESPTPLRNHSVEEQPRESHAAAFKCDQCPKRFTRAFNLRSHLRTHTSQRPFACRICSRPFTRRHDLNNHLMLHTGEKNFECVGCRKRFSRATALKRHSDSKTNRGCSAKHV